MILSRNTLKRVDESRHPCRTPTVETVSYAAVEKDGTSGLVIEVFDDLEKVCADVVQVIKNLCNKATFMCEQRDRRSPKESRVRIEVGDEIGAGERQRRQTDKLGDWKVCFHYNPFYPSSSNTENMYFRRRDLS